MPLYMYEAAYTAKSWAAGMKIRKTALNQLAGKPAKRSVAN